jgi:hypothetical protein
MKKIILSIAFIASGLVASAQVGVGTENPETSLHVVGANATSIGATGSNTPGALAATDGITVPVVTNDMTLPVPSSLVEGTKVSQLVYSTFATKEGYYYWTGSAWVPFGGAAAAAAPTYRTQVGQATMSILASDVGNIVLFNGGVSGDIVFPTPTTAMIGKKLTLISIDGNSHTLTQANANYKTSTLSVLQQFGSEFITDGTNWYGLGGQ